MACHQHQMALCILSVPFLVYLLKLEQLVFRHVTPRAGSIGFVNGLWSLWSTFWRILISAMNGRLLSE